MESSLEYTAQSSAYPTVTECNGISLANSSNSFDEVGVFHNAYLGYVDVSSITFQDADSIMEYLVANLVDFAISVRENYNFLPDDSTTCATTFSSWLSNNIAIQESDFYAEMDPVIIAPIGVSAGYEAYVDTLNEIFSDLDSDQIGLSEFIDAIKDWEYNVMYSTLITGEKNQLLRVGSISRYSSYFWGCDEDTLVTRACRFCKWLKRNWKVLAAFDIGGAVCCGPFGAALSSAGSGGIGWAAGWLP